MKTIIKLFVILIFINLTSCEKTTPLKVIEVNRTTDQLNVPQDFQWRTTNNTIVVLNGYAKDSPVRICDSNGKLLDFAMLYKDIPYTTVITTPTTEKIIIFEYLGQRVIMPIFKHNDTIIYTFN